MVVSGKKNKPNVVRIEYIMGRMDGASLIAQLVKNPPAMHQTPVRFLGQEDPLKGKATQSSILACRIPWTVVHGVAKSQTQLRNFYFGGEWRGSAWESRQGLERIGH